MKKIINPKPGFTLLELLFAIVLLGTMLSIMLVAIIGMLRFYVFSNQVRQNQENGRNMLDTMTREIRFGTLLFPKDSTPESDRICIEDKTNTRLIQYRFVAPDLLRSTFVYSPTISPKDCEVREGVSLATPEKKVNLDKMRVVDFVITKTRGAEVEANTDVTAVLIKLSYITGRPSPTNPSACETADIYCSNLILNTAVNIRGKGTK
jgi:prepilin-type N-terminal cleavage/methylation domain-containing protein